MCVVRGVHFKAGVARSRMASKHERMRRPSLYLLFATATEGLNQAWIMGMDFDDKDLSDDKIDLWE